METCRLIVDTPSGGTWNMAVDEAMLAAAAEEGVATVRFYQWAEPTLSLGYFQKHDERRQHTASRDCVIVRRQSGGGAILHDRELTYSIALPGSHPLTRQPERLYTAIHNAIIGELAPLIGRESQWNLKINCTPSTLLSHEESFLCFQRRARGDVVLVSAADSPSAGFGKLSPVNADSPNWKIVGSAQRRRRGAILQHGSVLLETSPSAPELAGFVDLTGVRCMAANLSAGFMEPFETALNMKMQPVNLPEEWRPEIAEIDAGKYAAATWTNRR